MVRFLCDVIHELIIRQWLTFWATLYSQFVTSPYDDNSHFMVYTVLHGNQNEEEPKITRNRHKAHINVTVVQCNNYNATK